MTYCDRSVLAPDCGNPDCKPCAVGNSAPQVTGGMEEEIRLIGQQVEAEFQMSGLSDGLYMDFALEVTKRALTHDRARLVEEVEAEKAKWNGNGEYYANVTEALDDVLTILKNGNQT